MMGTTKTVLLLMFLAYPCNILAAHVFSLGGDTQMKLVDSDSQLIARTVNKLYSKDRRERKEAKKQLTAIAGESVEARGQIIQALVTALEDPKTHEEDCFAAWSDVAELLGNLKATEAIHTLARHLDYSNGVVGLSLNHFPAAVALVRIGKPSIPSLALALTDERPSVRASAARALGEIGGPQAIQALEHRRKTEADAEVKFHITAALSRLKE